MLPRQDPSSAVAREAIQWHVDMLCFPTWQELLEVEYVRRLGNINMFTDDVQSHCKKLGLEHAVEWYSRLKQVKVIPTYIFGIAVEFYETDHGSQETWLTDDVVKNFEVLAVNVQTN